MSRLSAARAYSSGMNSRMVVDFNKEEASQDALDFKDFPKWRKAWDKIEDAPIRKAYHLFCLLSGVRPGEGARLRWSNVRDNEQSFTIPIAKAGKDIVLPASPEIMAVLRMAREATYKGHHEVKIADLVFPGCAQISAREALRADCQLARAHVWLRSRRASRAEHADS